MKDGPNSNTLSEYKNWTTVSTAVERIYEIQQQPTPIETLTSILTIIDDMIWLKLDRDAASAKLLTLQLSENEKEFVKAIASFINKLPPVSLDEDINEAEFCSRFVDPFMSG
ncbi:unnamed protein product [Mucor fragilis]